MPSIEITDEQHDRFTTLREELADTHADSYTSVTSQDTVAYLLDLADAVADPNRQATVDSVAASESDGSAPVDPFPRDRLEARLSERNRRYSEADPDDHRSRDSGRQSAVERERRYRHEPHQHGERDDEVERTDAQRPVCRQWEGPLRDGDADGDSEADEHELRERIRWCQHRSRENG